MVCDGCEQPVLVSSDKDTEQITFSPKKGCHTFTKHAAVAPVGHLLRLSQSFAGSKNDIQTYRCDIQGQIHLLMEEDECIIGDGIYGFLHKDHTALTPIVKLKDQVDLYDFEEEYNNELAVIRIVVENVFAHIKRYNICSHVFRGIGTLDKVLERHDKIWTVVGAIVNMYDMPLRCYR